MIGSQLRDGIRRTVGPTDYIATSHCILVVEPRYCQELGKLTIANGHLVRHVFARIGNRLQTTLLYHSVITPNYHKPSSNHLHRMYFRGMLPLIYYLLIYISIPTPLKRASNPLLLISLDLIAHLKVLPILKAHATLRPLPHLRHILLDILERVERA